MLIRQTRTEDAALVRDLRLEGLKNHPIAFGSDYDQDVTRPIEYWQERVTPSSHNAIFVGVEEDTFAGMVGIFRWGGAKMEHNGGIWGVYVRPKWRGSGLIDQLLGACVDWGKAHDVPVLKLGVAATNTSAIRAYVRCGFSVYGIDPQVIHYDGVYHDELLLCRVIQKG
jgi:RimJ/RimL family protein N-acetyltransferase